MLSRQKTETSAKTPTARDSSLLDCHNCHAIVCSQASEDSSMVGSRDNIPHVLVCASPEYCTTSQENKKTRRIRKRSQSRDETELQGSYPPKLALAAKSKSSTVAMTPSTQAQEEEIKSSAMLNSGKSRNAAANRHARLGQNNTI